MLKNINLLIFLSFLFICFLSCTSQSINVTSDFTIDFESVSFTDSTSSYSGKHVQNNSFQGEKALTLPEKQNKLQHKCELQSSKCA